MATTRIAYGTPEATADKCSLPFLDPSGKIVFFDVQPAEPGTFTVPGVIDLETYEPGSTVETSWIFFKGDPQAGPQPGHPFDRPFNDTTKFSIGLVDEDDTTTVLHEVMPPTNSSLFWKGGAPFGRPGDHSMYIPRLDGSCEYYFIGEMIYRWKAPNDLKADSVFRLKLTTDVPATAHLSGKLGISRAQNLSSPTLSLMGRSWEPKLSAGGVATLVSAVVFLLLLIRWVFMRLRRGSERVVLE